MSTVLREATGKRDLGIPKCLPTIAFQLSDFDIFSTEKGLHLCPSHTSYYGKLVREATSGTILDTKGAIL